MAQPQPGASPPVDETLTPYVSTADSVALPDGRMLHFVCMGEGSPTVILSAGLGDFAGAGWSTVQPAMARNTRVCAWDRPGLVADRGHAELAKLSTRGVDTRVPGANHYIQRTQPQAVLDAVAEVVDEARATSR